MKSSWDKESASAREWLCGMNLHQEVNASAHRRKTCGPVHFCILRTTSYAFSHATRQHACLYIMTYLGQMYEYGRSIGRPSRYPESENISIFWASEENVNFSGACCSWYKVDQSSTPQYATYISWWIMMSKMSKPLYHHKHVDQPFITPCGLAFSAGLPIWPYDLWLSTSSTRCCGTWPQESKQMRQDARTRKILEKPCAYFPPLRLPCTCIKTNAYQCNWIQVELTTPAWEARQRQQDAKGCQFSWILVWSSDKLASV